MFAAVFCGADGVTIVSCCRAEEAPGRKYHWGMATPSPVSALMAPGFALEPRAHVVKILRGPAQLDGTHNLLGALKRAWVPWGQRY